MDIITNFICTHPKIATFISDLFIALLGSFVGFYLALMASKKQESKNNRDILLHFSSMIDNIISSTKKQMEFVKELIKKTTERPLDYHLIGLVATLDFERVRLVDSNTLYKSFNFYYKNSLEEFNKTFSYLDYLSIISKDFISRNEKHITFIHNDQIYVRDHLEKLIYSIGMYLKRIHEQDPEFKSDPNYLYLSPFMSRLSELTKSANNDLSIYESEILVPMHDSILHKLDDLEFGEQLFNIIKESRNRIDSIRFNSVEFARTLSQDNDTIEKAITKLETVSSKIKKIKQK